MEGNYDFDTEARKLIESTLLALTDEVVVPITGHDIMERFGIPHGREVGYALKRAQSIYLHSLAPKRN